MALITGDATATTGMAREIYLRLDQVLSPKIPPAALPEAQASWRQLAFAIASGVVTHIVSNMEVTGVQTTASASLPVSSGTAAGIVNATQAGPTTGLVR